MSKDMKNMLFKEQRRLLVMLIVSIFEAIEKNFRNYVYSCNDLIGIIKSLEFTIYTKTSFNRVKRYVNIENQQEWNPTGKPVAPL